LALEFMDGFDHYSTGSWLATKWDASSYTNPASVTGRFGGLAMALDSVGPSGAFILTASQLSSQPTRVIGFAVKISGVASNNMPSPQQNGGYPFISVMDDATEQLRLGIDSNGSLWVVRDPGGAVALLGHSAANALTQNTWYYLEFKYTIHSSAGSYDIHVNGTSVLSGTSKNTQASGNTSSNGIQIWSNWTTNIVTYPMVTIDDVYVLNSTGSSNNTFLGECQILTSLPASDGSNTGLTPNSGTAHFSRVNESDPNSDTSYVSANTAGATDTYHFAPVSASGAVAGVQIVMTARRDATGTRAVAGVTKSGATTDVGSPIVLNSSYRMARQIEETDPGTSAAWTTSGINSAQFGVRVL
jgi:hypothetical protein